MISMPAATAFTIAPQIAAVRRHGSASTNRTPLPTLRRHGSRAGRSAGSGPSGLRTSAAASVTAAKEMASQPNGRKLARLKRAPPSGGPASAAPCSRACTRAMAAAS